MKHYKVVNKQNNKEVWRGIADSKYEAHERAYMKMIFEITESLRFARSEELCTR